MTLLFADGFDMGDADKKWSDIYALWGTSLNPTTSTRFGVGSAIIMTGSTSAQFLIRKTFTASAKVIVGFAFKYTNTADTADIIRLMGDNNTTQHLSLRVLTTGAVALYRGTTQIATSAINVFPPSTWGYLEMSATISDTVGAVEVRLNGATIITFSGDTKNAGTASTIDTFVWWYGLSNMQPAIDDVYICNGLGTVNNDFLGDVRIQALKPNAAGSTTQLTPVGSGTNYLNVDDATPSAADYNYSTTAGHRDLYGLEDVAAGTSAIKAVQVCSMVRKTDSGARSVKNLVRVGGTTTASAATALGGTSAVVSAIHETNPTSAAAWAVGDISALEAGVEVV